MQKIRLKQRLARLGMILGLAAGMGMVGQTMAAVGEPEKDELKFGFIKLTDMAPLAVAYEKGYFEDEGLGVIGDRPEWR